MKNYIWFGAGLLVGGTLGAYFMKKLVEKTYSEHAKTQIEEVVAYYRNNYVPKTKKRVEKKEELKTVPQEKHKEEPTLYELLKQSEKLSKKEDIEVDTGLEVISIDDYNYIPGYSQETFVLYGDGIMTDDSDIPMSDSDVENLFGPDVFDKINACDDSSIYVRNPMEMIDYEIIMCPTEFNG